MDIDIYCTLSYPTPDRQIPIEIREQSDTFAVNASPDIARIRQQDSYKFDIIQ